MYQNLPRLDLHGCDREYASFLTRQFLEDYYKIGEKRVVIIHGKGSGIVRKCVFDILRKHQLVESFALNMFNDGETIVILKEKKKR